MLHVYLITGAASMQQEPDLVSCQCCSASSILFPSWVVCVEEIRCVLWIYQARLRKDPRQSCWQHAVKPLCRHASATMKCWHLSCEPQPQSDWAARSTRPGPQDRHARSWPDSGPCATGDHRISYSQTLEQPPSSVVPLSTLMLCHRHIFVDSLDLDLCGGR